MAVVAVLFNFVYHPTLGILSNSFKLLGIKQLSAFPWLGDAATVLPSIIFVAIWQATGFYMVLFMAGMGSIPTEYYEAAKIDRRGASGPSSGRSPCRCCATRCAPRRSF